MGSRAQSIDVTVVMPVFDALPYLVESLESLLAQDIGSGRFELIAIDDGSTDGSLGVLEQYESRFAHCTVVAGGHTGSPAAPRNQGIERARGRYIFFLDADDMLESYALSEMVGAADENGTDMVVPKQRALGGRSVPIQAFRATLPVTDIFEADVYRILGPVKLFRTSFIRDNELRFPEGLTRKSDVPFGVETYLCAGSISVLADRDYLVVRLRDDGGNLTVNRTRLADHVPVVRFVFAAVAAKVPPGAQRDQLMTRHFRTELAKAVLEGFPGEPDEQYRRACYEEFVALVHAYCTQAVLWSLPVRERVVVHLLLEDDYETLCSLVEALAESKHPEVIAEDGALYLDLPGFRDAGLSLPDALYKVGTKSCLLVNAVGAKGARRSTQVELVGRILVANSPITDLRVELRNAEGDVFAPVSSVNEFEVAAGDVPQVVFRVGWDQILLAAKALEDGWWTVTVSLMAGEVFLRSAVYYLESARGPLDDALGTVSVLDKVWAKLTRARRALPVRTRRGYLALRISHAR